MIFFFCRRIISICYDTVYFRKHHYHDRNLSNWRHHNKARDTNTKAFLRRWRHPASASEVLPAQMESLFSEPALPPPYFAPLALVIPLPAFPSHHLVFSARYSFRKKILDNTTFF